MPRSVPLRSCTALRDGLLQCEGMAVCCCNPPDNNSRRCGPAQVKVALSDVRGLLETMVAADFLDLQQKAYMMLNADEEDWRKLKLHSISIKATRGSARRDFSAGEYGGETSGNPGEIRNNRVGDCRIDIKGQFHGGTLHGRPIALV